METGILAFFRFGCHLPNFREFQNYSLLAFRLLSSSP